MDLCEVSTQIAHEASQKIYEMTIQIRDDKIRQSAWCLCASAISLTLGAKTLAHYPKEERERISQTLASEMCSTAAMLEEQIEMDSEENME